MRPNENTAHWRTAASRAHGGTTARRAAIVLALIAFIAMGGQYLAGCLFLRSISEPIADASVLTTLRYLYYYRDRADVISRVKTYTALGWGFALALVIPVIVPTRRKLHGEARFARRHEAARAGLLSHTGIILGRIFGRYVILAGQQGIALAAPPRSGKGVGVVIPNLLSWPDSVVCTDIKLENWHLTSGFRAASGHACFLFNPLAENGRTARWNPLSYVSPYAHQRINDLQRIADLLYPEVPGTDPFWIASARSLFVGIGLYLFETPSLPKTIGEVLRQGMASDDEGFSAHWKRIIEGRKSGRFPLSAECVRALYDLIDLAPITASSIRKTFTSRLDLWQNPILDAATSADDFDLRELRRNAMAIYVGIQPDDLHRLRPVLSLFFQQTIGLQTRVLPEHDRGLKLQVLMLLDEFAALGRIPIMAESISYLPGYNVRVALVFHTPAQLREVYGANAAETMMKALAARIVFAPRDFHDAKEISDELGYSTVKVRSHSRPRFAAWGHRGSSSSGSTTTSEQRRALLLPQEVQQLGRDQSILFYEGLGPLRCRKIRYFDDRRFRARLRPAQKLPAPNWKPFALLPQSVPSHAPKTGEGAMRVSPVSAASAAGEKPPPLPTTAETREPTAEDIERIHELKVEDFAIDVDKLQFPLHGNPLSDQEMAAAVESFISTMRSP
jgi:type IV secretion system protein VirD4